MKTFKNICWGIGYTVVCMIIGFGILISTITTCVGGITLKLFNDHKIASVIIGTATALYTAYLTALLMGY